MEVNLGHIRKIERKARFLYKFYGLQKYENQGVFIYYKIETNEKQEKVLNVAGFFNISKKIMNMVEIKKFLSYIIPLMQKENIKKLSFVPVNDKLRKISEKLNAEKVQLDLPQRMLNRMSNYYGTEIHSTFYLTLEQIINILAEKR